MQTYQQPINYKALSWTVGAHVLILLLLILWKFSTPAAATPVVELGMEVNLGTSADGSGDDQPMDREYPAAEAAATSARQSSTPEVADDRAVEQTDDEEAPAVAPIKVTKTPRLPVPKPERPVVRTNAPVTPRQQAQQAAATAPQKPRFVYQGSTGRGGNGAQEDRPGGGEGNTTGSGDRGVPNGTPGAANYTGSPGKGTGGINHSLTDRRIVDYPPKEAEFRQGGTVVVRVTVNRDGTIVSKNVLSASNSELSAIALRKVAQVKFNRKEDAPAEQFGKITFVFKARN